MDNEMLRSIEEELFISRNFRIPGVYQLLEAIHCDELDKTKVLLPEVLTRIKEKYDLQRNYISQVEGISEEEGISEDEGISDDEGIFWDARHSWKNNRINLYDKLLLFSLGGSVADWEEWDTYTCNTTHPSALKFNSAGKIHSDFAPGSIHKYLLDHILENDDIRLKYNRDEDGFRRILGLKAIWLVRSMERYTKHVINPTLAKLTTLGFEDVNRLLEAIHYNDLDQTKVRFPDVLTGRIREK
jgi:hypothetical protein